MEEENGSYEFSKIFAEGSDEVGEGGGEAATPALTCKHPAVLTDIRGHYGTLRDTKGH